MRNFAAHHIGLHVAQHIGPAGRACRNRLQVTRNEGIDGRGRPTLMLQGILLLGPFDLHELPDAGRLSISIATLHHGIGDVNGKQDECNREYTGSLPVVHGIDLSAIGYLAIQRGEAHLEDLGGLFLVVAHLLEHMADVLHLAVADVGLE